MIRLRNVRIKIDEVQIEQRSSATNVNVNLEDITEELREFVTTYVNNLMDQVENVKYSTEKMIEHGFKS